jgi:hypothetical protein
LEFFVSKNEVLLKPKTASLDEVFGMVKTTQAHSLEEMDAAISEYHRHKAKA